MTTTDAEQLQVRPTLRVLGAIVMLLLAALMVYDSVRFFSAETISLKSCAGEYKASSKILCEIGNSIVSILPAQMQGPLEGLAHLATAALLILLSWMLTKPLYARSHRRLPDSSSRRMASGDR